MSKLWQDIRGQYLGEAVEDHGPRRVLALPQKHGPKALDMPLWALVRNGLPTRPKREFISPALRWEVWERDDFTCRSCGSRRFLTVDHIYPVARGGQTKSFNLQTLCRTCNSRKHAKVPL